MLLSTRPLEPELTDALRPVIDHLGRSKVRERISLFDTGDSHYGTVLRLASEFPFLQRLGSGCFRVTYALGNLPYVLKVETGADDRHAGHPCLAEWVNWLVLRHTELAPHICETVAVVRAGDFVMSVMPKCEVDGAWQANFAAQMREKLTKMYVRITTPHTSRKRKQDGYTGNFHFDLHDQNVMYRWDNEQPVITDYGWRVCLVDPKVKQKISRGRLMEGVICA